MLKTLDQQRAEYAWKCTQAAKDIEDYTREAKGVPVLIMTSGLMQTLAFLCAKGKNHHLELLDQICCWLGKILGGTPVTAQDRFLPEPVAKFEIIMEALYKAPSSLYLRATDESLALMRWIRQFADARKSMEYK